MSNPTLSRRRRARRFEIEIEPGTYARIPAWSSREQYAHAASAAAKSARWRADRRTSLLRVVEVLSVAADGSTGRSVSLSVATVAARTGLSRRTVFRRLADLRELGLMVVVDRGQHLPGPLRRAARETTGRTVIRKTSTRALAVPAALASVTPPTPSGVGSSSDLSLDHQARTARRTKSSSTKNRKPRSLRLQRLAAKVETQMPWISRGQHIGGLITALERGGVDETWTEGDVVTAIDSWHHRHGRVHVGRDMASVLGWLVWVLREAVSEGAKPRAVQRQEAAMERQRARAARKPTWEAEDQAAVQGDALTSAAAAVRAALTAARRNTLSAAA